MPRTESPKKRLPFFVRLRTVDDMKAVAKTLAEIKVEIGTIEESKSGLQSADRKQQKAALVNIAVSSMNAANKAEEIIFQVQAVKNKLQKYLDDTGVRP